MSDFVPTPARPAPRSSSGVIGWLRLNLFSTPLNGLMTLVVAYLVVTSLTPVLDWALFSANFSGEDQSACVSGGACWVFVKSRMSLFFYGFVPETVYWRINVLFVMLALLILGLTVERFPYRKPLALFAVFGFPVVAFVLMHGGVLGLETVTTDRWGGLSLNLILAYVGIMASLPFGILLALGRRSQMPVIRSLSIGFIEFWRGVPLISVLFMASVMLPLFLPEGMDINKLLRAMIGIILFQSAYMAEVVRGGLQAIPRGQYEAAAAIGLNYWQSMVLIILPQALKLVIPGIVNTFIALFKDTTLVLIIGLLEILAAVQSSVSDPAWRDVSIEGYVFTAMCFWVFCFGMSRYSQVLERKLDTGFKR